MVWYSGYFVNWSIRELFSNEAKGRKYSTKSDFLAMLNERPELTGWVRIWSEIRKVVNKGWNVYKRHFSVTWLWKKRNSKSKAWKWEISTLAISTLDIRKLEKIEHQKQVHLSMNVALNSNNHLRTTNLFRSQIIEFIRSKNLDDTGSGSTPWSWWSV